MCSSRVFPITTIEDVGDCIVHSRIICNFWRKVLKVHSQSFPRTQKKRTSTDSHGKPVAQTSPTLDTTDVLSSMHLLTIINKGRWAVPGFWGTSQRQVCMP
jgi:hypothetical protein